MSDHTDPDYTDPDHILSSRPSKHKPYQNGLLRWAFFIMGFIFVGLGVLGVILPGMPTTVFILLAGYCWAKSSRRFYDWLIKHKIFGKILIDWEERHAMPRFAKYLAWGMMTISSAFLFWRLPADKLWIAALTCGICLMTAIWMYRLPDA